jgi:sphingolipid delta-4 desaturase
VAVIVADVPPKFAVRVVFIENNAYYLCRHAGLPHKPVLPTLYQPPPADNIHSCLQRDVAPDGLLHRHKIGIRLRQMYYSFVEEEEQMPEHSDFLYSKSSEPHRVRTREMLKKHPEIRKLIGRNPRSFLFILGLVSLNGGLAVLSSQQPWWLILLTAYFIGAFVNHGLFVMIHEGSHDLIFKRRIWNTLAVIIADLSNFVPSAISFRRYHLKHHSFQGIYDLDADLPSRWEARLMGNSAIGKSLWLLLFPLFQALRPPRLKEIKFSSLWTWINVAAVFAFNIAIFSFFGPKALLYLALSLGFSVGLHPLGARWIQEHYIVNYPQETYSYYGLLNTLAFNVGYHNEHHDLPSVPWNRLPEIKRMAPEYYDSLVSHDSWFRLLIKFIFDPELSLFSRVRRDERGGVALEAGVGVSVTGKV